MAMEEAEVREELAEAFEEELSESVEDLAPIEEISATPDTPKN